MIRNLILRFGIYLGAGYVLLHMSQYATNNLLEPHWFFALLRYTISIGVIVWGMKLYKVKDNSLSFEKALKIGLGVAIVSGFIFGIYNIIFTSLIEPDFIENLLNKMEMEQVLFERGMNEEQIEQSVKITKKIMNNSLLRFAIDMISSVFLGLVIAIIAGMILKTRRK